MAKRSIKWTKTAARQRRSILKYWVKRTYSSEYSIKLLYLTKERIQYLIEHPFSGQQVDYPNTRVVLLGHYSIYYKITTDEIIVTAFWDNRQDPKKLYRLLRSDQ